MTICRSGAVFACISTEDSHTLVVKVVGQYMLLQIQTNSLGLVGDFPCYLDFVFCNNGV